MYKLQFKDNPQRGLWLVGEKICLGSAENNDWVLSGPGINSHHAQILIENDGIVLQMIDGQCSVNERPVDSRCELVCNDEIQIGRHRLIVLDSKQVEAQQSTQSAQTSEGQDIEKASQSWALIANHSQLKNQRFAITRNALIGRGKDCDFRVPYKLLSRQHALFTVDGRGLLVTDLDSSNGTYVNHKRIKQARLKGGEIVSLAKLNFTVRAPQMAQTDDDLNRTMIRPALNAQVELQATPDENEDSKLTQEISTETQNQPVVPEQQPIHQGRWLVLTAALAGLAVGCWWLLPFIK